MHRHASEPGRRTTPQPHTPRSAQVISTGHAFIQNLRRGRYEFGMDVDPLYWFVKAFSELMNAV
jgi:hypothetical protein